MSTETTLLFLGDPILDENEVRFMRRLRADLAKAGVEATVLANFLADPRNGSRQVDFLIWTDGRLTHVELKTLNPDAHLTAPANGQWSQLLPGGQSRTIGNGFRQALQTTFAISDELRALERRGVLTGSVGDYKRHIDTVVCIQPNVPAGSTIQTPRHITLCGYQDLLARISTPGNPPPGWNSDVVRDLARALNLYAEPEDAEAATVREVDLNELASYRSAVTLDLSTDLSDLVRLSVEEQTVTGSSPAVIDGAEVVDQVLASGGAVTVVGQSGSGKSHLIRHAVIHRTSIDVVPVWMVCRDYEGDTFSVAMAKATARFSSHQWADLFDRARRQGLVPAVILDGLNECSADMRRILLEGVQAYRNSRGCAVVVTDQSAVPIAGARELVTLPPSEDQRQEVLACYGADRLPGAEAFATPWELSMAASCAADLPEGADAVNVFETYCRQNSTNEVQRDQLRALAIAMRRDLRLAVPFAAVRAAIAQYADRRATAEEMDALLASPLLDIGVRHVSFTHETLGNFLAAEHLVTTARDGLDLADQISDPTVKDLASTAVRLERAPSRRVDALLGLGDSELLARAATGELGAEVERGIQDAMRATLVAAQDVTAAARFIYTGDPEAAGPVAGHWLRPEVEGLDMALLSACGRALSDGVLVPEVVALLDQTDVRADATMRELRALGVKAAITAVFGATYEAGLTRSWGNVESEGDLVAGDLPATVVLRSAEFFRFRALRKDPKQPGSVLIRFAAPDPARWGRVAMALTLLNYDSDEDLHLLPDLIDEAWKLNGYHLRLMALYAAHGGANNGDEDMRARLAEVLERMDVSQNWALSSLMVEALAACGAIEPMATEADLREEIARVLAQPDDPGASDLARSILGRQFEDEAIFGPVSQVVGELPPAELVELCGLALAYDDEPPFSIARDWATARIVEHVEHVTPRERQILAQIAGSPPAASMAAYEGLNAHFDALRAWAVLEEELPRWVSDDVDLAGRTWRLIDGVIFLLIKGRPDEVAPAWSELLDLCRPTAVDALLQMSVPRWDWRKGSTYPLIAGAYPGELRALYEWALENWPDVEPATGRLVHASRETLARELGAVGDNGTRLLLQAHLGDPELSPHVVSAISAIEARLTSG